MMSKDFDFDSFAKRLKSRILSGENPSKLRKWVREQMGVGKTRGNEIYAKICNEISPEEFPRVEVIEVRDDTKVSIENNDMTVTTTGDITSIDELVKYANIDLTVWEPIKQKMTVWDGKTSFSAEFKKKVEEKKFEEFLEIFKDQAQRHAPVKFAKIPKRVDGKLLAINFSDAHIGKRGEKSETGHESYNLDLSVRIFEETFDNLLSRALDYGTYSESLFIVGNDLFNSDGLSGLTTAGTAVENDGSWFFTYKTVCGLITRCIEKLGAVTSKVNVIVVPGNHDFESCFTLGQYLEAWFRNHEGVLIVNEAKPRKYFRFFNNLFCLTHGNEEKTVDLPLVMATESRDWSECSNREVWVGHTHKIQVTEDRGVITRVFPSLSGCDFWHGKKSFVGNHRVGQLLIYNTDGLEAILQHQPKLN